MKSFVIVSLFAALVTACDSSTKVEATSSPVVESHEESTSGAAAPEVSASASPVDASAAAVGGAPPAVVSATPSASAKK